MRNTTPKLLAAVATCLTLAACTGTSDPGGSEGEGDAQSIKWLIEEQEDAEALKALARFAHASRDPWLTLLADRERAWSDDMRGRASAEQLLLNTLRTCEAYTRLFNCTQIN